MFELCERCKQEKAREEDDICPYQRTEDNLPLRCVGSWSKDKFYYLSRYMDIFNSATKYKWKNRVFIDLFAGPGKCIVRDSGEIINGSSLIALEQKNPFTHVISIDIDELSIKALKKRGEIIQSEIQFNTYASDCNLIVDKIRENVDSSFLALVLIDPTSMQIKYSTIKKLTEELRMDLVINYPLHTINRAYMDAIKGNDRVFNDYFGTEKWKDMVFQLGEWHNVATKLLPFYKEQLKNIGYKTIQDLNSFQADEILVKGPKNIPLYYLFFASKNPLGNKLWQEIKRIRHNKQSEFSF